MLNDNLTNNSCNNQSQLEDKVDRLEKVIEGYDQRFNTQDLHTQKLTANTANIANIEAAGIKSDNVDAGALSADSAVVTGSIKAKSFTVEDPVIINGVITPTANVGTLDATDINAVNGKITNLTVDNLMTGPDSSLEYKNLSVTNQATINKLNLVDPHVAEIIADNAKAVDFETQNIKMLSDGKITRLDNNANVMSYVDGATILGDVNNDINIAGKSRPKWNDLSLATLADIQTGGVKPVYRGEVENFSQLPITGNVKGDLYVVRKLVISDKMGIGHAQWNGESWDPSLIYELELFETAADFEEAVRALTTLIEDNAKAIEDEMQDAVNRESAIVDGIKGSRVKKVEEGCTMGDAGNLLATTDDAFMLYGAEGPDNIPSSVTSLDDLVTCSQYSISEGKASKYTDKPADEDGAFDLVVGYFNTDKNQPYQVYTSKKTNDIYYRNSTDGVYNEWIKVAKVNESLQFRSKTRILPPDDLGNYLTPGQYYIFSTADAEKISATPVNEPADFYVFGSLGEIDINQVYITWENNEIYIRGWTSSYKWKPWKKISYTKEVETYKREFARNLKNESLANLKTAGSYNCLYVDGGSVTDKPDESLAFSVDVINRGSSITQMYYPYFSDETYIRNDYGDGWNDWKKSATSADTVLLGKEGYKWTDATDFNDIKEVGVYATEGVSMANAPWGDGTYCTVIVDTPYKGDDHYIRQTANNSYGKTAFRRYSTYNSVWEDWKEVATVENEKVANTKAVYIAEAFTTIRSADFNNLNRSVIPEDGTYIITANFEGGNSHNNQGNLIGHLRINGTDVGSQAVPCPGANICVVITYVGILKKGDTLALNGYNYGWDGNAWDLTTRIKAVKIAGTVPAVSMKA